MKNYKTIIAVVAAGLVCSVMTTKASMSPLFAPTGAVLGGSVGTTSLGTLSGLVGDTGPLSYSFGNGSDTGTVETEVYTSNSEAGALGGLSFVYILKVTQGDLSQFNPNGFGGLGEILVGTAAGVSPAVGIGWSAINGVININYGVVNALTGTSTIVINTSATSFGGNIAGLQDNAPDGGINILAPVPEPSTVVAGALMLLPFGIGAIRSLRKDRTA